MKLARIVIILAALAAPSLAHADDETAHWSNTVHRLATVNFQGVAYYDLAKALADSADAKKAAADLKADQEKQQAEIDGIEAEAKKLDAKCAKSPASVPAAGSCVDASAKHQRASDLFRQYSQQGQQRAQAAQVQLAERIKRIVPAVAKAKRLAALVPVSVAYYAAPALDVTGEIVRRLDAGEGKDDAEVRSELQKKLAEKEARIAALEREKAELTKPVAPSVPPPPPIQPVASKGLRR